MARLRLDDRPHLPHRFVMLDDGPGVGHGRRDLGLQPARISLGFLGRLEL